MGRAGVPPAARNKGSPASLPDRHVNAKKAGFCLLLAWAGRHFHGIGLDLFLDLEFVPIDV